LEPCETQLLLEEKNIPHIAVLQARRTGVMQSGGLGLSPGKGVYLFMVIPG
jgi:hypothetical protein